MKNVRRSIVFLAASVAVLAVLAPAAGAGVVDYPFTRSFSVPNQTDNGGLPAQVFVPDGRTPATKVELVGVKPSYGGGGGTDFQLFLSKPGQAVGTSLMTSSCAAILNTTSFTLTDDSATAASSANCATLQNGVLKPDSPLADFAGPSAGAWTVGVRDVGLVAMPNGSFNGYTLRLTHAAPTLTATAKQQLLSPTLYLTVTPDADGKVTTGGDALPGPAVAVTANEPATIPFSLAGPVRKKVKKKRKAIARVTVTLADETNGTVAQTVDIKVKKPKKPKKPKK